MYKFSIRSAHFRILRMHERNLVVRCTFSNLHRSANSFTTMTSITYSDCHRYYNKCVLKKIWWKIPWIYVYIQEYPNFSKFLFWTGERWNWSECANVMMHIRPSFSTVVQRGLIAVICFSFCLANNAPRIISSVCAKLSYLLRNFMLLLFRWSMDSVTVRFFFIILIHLYGILF